MALRIVSNRTKQQNRVWFCRSEHTRTSSQPDLQSYLHTIYTMLHIPGRSGDLDSVPSCQLRWLTWHQSAEIIGSCDSFLLRCSLGPTGGAGWLTAAWPLLSFGCGSCWKILLMRRLPHTHRTQAFICNHANDRHAWCLSELSVPGLETGTA